MISTVITALGNLLSKFFDWKKSETEHKLETDIISDKKDYKKAVDIAEKIIDIAEKYKQEMSMAHRLKFSHLVQDFKKYN